MFVSPVVVFNPCYARPHLIRRLYRSSEHRSVSENSVPYHQCLSQGEFPVKSPQIGNAIWERRKFGDRGEGRKVLLSPHCVFYKLVIGIIDRPPPLTNQRSHKRKRYQLTH